MKYGKKYGNKKTQFNGIVFDSKKEAGRYADLLTLERCGVICNLELQKEFELIPAQYDIVDGKRKCVERACKYIADFYYYDKEHGEYVCEDTKGVRTKDYIIKRKLMLFRHGIKILEI